MLLNGIDISSIFYLSMVLNDIDISSIFYQWY